MEMTSTKNSLFAQLNDKRLIFSDNVFSVPIGHMCLEKLRECKRNSQKKIKDLIIKSKKNVLKIEDGCLLSIERIKTLKEIVL